MAASQERTYENVKLLAREGGGLVGEVEDTGSLTVRGKTLEFHGESSTFSMPNVKRLSLNVLGRLVVEFEDVPEERHFLTGRGLGVRKATKGLFADLEATMSLAPVSMSEAEVQDLTVSARRQMWLSPLALVATPLLFFAMAFGFRFLWRGIFGSDWDAEGAYEFAFGFGVTGIGFGILYALYLIADGRAKLRRSRGD